MHEVSFLQDLAVVLIIAGVVTILFHRLKQPVVLGYIIAGVIIGPYTPIHFVHDEQMIHTLSELGVILLMFALGLEFSLRKLKKVGGAAAIAAFLEILLMVWVGYEIGRAFGWSKMDSVFLGAILSISSTTIIIKALRELGKTKEHFAQLIFGILIIEDILGIAMIALLSGIAMTGSLSFGEVGVTLGRLGIFLVVVLVVGLLSVPRLLGYVAKFKSNEMLLITALALCFGVSLLAEKLGYSVALGAFIIGAVVAEAREIHRIETLIEPVRDMFSAIFFVAIGLLINPKVLVDYWLPILVITFAVVIGKVVTCSFGAFIGGNDTRTSLRVGMGLSQIGEFSFIIASLGLTLNVTSGFLYPIAVAVSAITTLLTPYLIKSSDQLVNWFDRLAPRPLVESTRLYTQWVGQLGERRRPSLSAKFIRKWILQVALNAALMAGIFIAAAFLAQRPPAWLPKFAYASGGAETILWLGAVICSLPLFIATFRKLQALGMLVAETRGSPAGSRARAVVSHGIPLAGTTILALLMMALSSALLPPLKILFVLLIVIALITFLLWRFFIRIYSKAQIALKETLAEMPDPKHETKPTPLPSLLKSADLELVSLAPDSFAAGKLISELQLRTVSGASIVGIERNGVSILNPGPDEELLANDQVLLLGSAPQLEAGKALLSARGISP